MTKPLIEKLQYGTRRRMWWETSQKTDYSLRREVYREVYQVVHNGVCWRMLNQLR